MMKQTITTKRDIERDQSPIIDDADPETVVPQTEDADFSMLRSLTRLAVGSMLEGKDELARRLQEWEETAVININTARTNETDKDRLRYALIGYLFESQKQIGQHLPSLQSVYKGSGKILSIALYPLRVGRRINPFQDRVEGWVDYGAAELARWIEVGRDEDQRSRHILKQAVGDSFDEIIDQVANNPQLEEMVHQQSMNLAVEMVEETRERMVSADTLVERFARSLFKKPPRETLPEPPIEVQAQSGRDYLGKPHKKERQ